LQVDWSADGDYSSTAFLGRWHHRSLLQAATASSDIDASLHVRAWHILPATSSTTRM